MKTDETGFAQLLKKEITQRVFFIYGDDDYLKSMYCDRLVRACVPEEFQVFNLHRFDDGKPPFGDVFGNIFETADNYPLMSEKTCLLIRNFELSALKKEALTDFTGKLTRAAETTVFVFYFDTVEVEYGPRWRPTAWNEIIDALADIGVVAEINSRTPERLASLLVGRAPERGTTIDSEAAAYLIACVGTDMQNLLNEFNKVCAYSRGKPVSREMIDNVCVKTVDADVFMICDSIFTGKNDRAFAVLNELLRLGVTAQEILGAMNSTFVNMYRLKVALNANRGAEDVARIFALNGGQTVAVKKLVNTVRPMRISAVRRCLALLSDADMKIKRSGGADSVILTELIAMLCEVTKNA